MEGRTFGENAASPGEYDTVEIRFHGCDAGWIRLTIVCGEQKTTISCSHWIDPFPRMIAWLEDIADGRVFCRWPINEEGWASVVSCFRREDGLSRLLIHGYQTMSMNIVGDFPEEESEWDQVAIDALIDPGQFVAEFYSKFRDFAHGDEYVRREWAMITMRDDLKAQFPDRSIDEIADGLAGFSAQKLNEFMWTMYPGHCFTCPGLASKGEELKAFGKWVMAGQKELPDGAVLTPDPHFEAPADFDRWDGKRKTGLIFEWLDTNVSPCEGKDILSLDSKRLETIISRTDTPAGD